ncbi:MAG: ASCH domain-containing protein, partial [Cetobacterium sp.]
FENVSEEFAKKEGEGDLSLDHWRKAHEKFFQGDEKKNSLILEEFHLVYSI